MEQQSTNRGEQKSGSGSANDDIELTSRGHERVPNSHGSNVTSSLNVNERHRFIPRQPSMDIDETSMSGVTGYSDILHDGVRTFHPIQFRPMHFQQLLFQPLTISSYCIFNLPQFQPKLNLTNGSQLVI